MTSQKLDVPGLKSTSQKLDVPGLKYKNEIKIMTTQEIVKLWNAKKLKIPPYQRTPEVWKDLQKQELYQTMTLGEKLPVIDARYENGNYLVEEGQQRIYNAIQFVKNKAKIKKVGKRTLKYRIGTPEEKLYYDNYVDKKFLEFPKDVQKKILDYPFVLSIAYGNEEDGVKYYRKANTLVKILSKAEKKRAFHYRGAFYKAIAKKTKDFESFYKDFNILSEYDLGRYGGQLLTADSVILALRGAQPSSKIDEFYRLWKDDFPFKNEAFEDLEQAIETIKKMFPNRFSKSGLNKPNNYYALLGAVFNQKGQVNNPEEVANRLNHFMASVFNSKKEVNAEEYWKTLQEGTGSLKNRKRRVEILADKF